MLFNIREKLSKLKYDTIKKIAYWKSTGDERLEYDKNRELKAYLQQCEEAWGTPAFRGLYERLDPLTYQTNWKIDHKNLDRLYALDCKAFRKYWNRRIIPDWKYDDRLRSMSHHLERWFPYRYDKKLCNEYYGKHNVIDLETLEPKYRLRISYEIWNDRIYWSEEELREKVIKTREERASLAEVAAELKQRLPHVAAPHVVVPVSRMVPGSRSPKLSLVPAPKDLGDGVPAREGIEEVPALEELSLKVKDPDDEVIVHSSEDAIDDGASLMTLDEDQDDAQVDFYEDVDRPPHPTAVTIYNDVDAPAVTIDDDDNHSVDDDDFHQEPIDDEVMTDDGDTPLTIHDDKEYDPIDDPSNYDDNEDEYDNNNQVVLKVPITLPKCCSYDAMTSYQAPTAIIRLPHSISAAALIIA